MNSLIALSDPQLLHGLEALICDWLTHPEPAPVCWPKFPGLVHWLELSPPSVRQYWEISQRWPQANLEGSQDSLAMRVYRGFPVLVDENQGCWSVYLKDGVVWHSENDAPLGTTLEQFLTTFGLYEFIIGQSDETLWCVKDDHDPLSPLEKEAELIWEGPYGHFEHPIRFWYHGIGVLWLDGGTALVGAVRNGSVLKELNLGVHGQTTQQKEPI
jgi:hypothetical protein